MFPTPKYLGRDLAAKFLNEQFQGAREFTEAQLADMAYRGKGPQYGLVRGRAVYREDWLLEWFEEQVAKPVGRRRRKADSRSTATRA